MDLSKQFSTDFISFSDNRTGSTRPSCT